MPLVVANLSQSFDFYFILFTNCTLLIYGVSCECEEVMWGICLFPSVRESVFFFFWVLEGSKEMVSEACMRWEVCLI